MRSNIKYLMLAAMIFSMNSCKPKAKQNGEAAVYVYTFEKQASLTTDNSKKLVSDFLGIPNPHELVVSKDENIAYFVSDEDVNTTFEQDLNNGNFAFSKLTSSYLAGQAPNLPSKDEAVNIARTFMKSKGLAPKNEAELKLVHTGGVRAQSVVNGKQAGPVLDKLITLTYGRTIDSLPVIGSGSKIIINIGDKGEVVGMTRHWREVELAGRKEVKQEEMITLKEAEELARKQILSEFGQNSGIEIKSSRRSYYDGNGNILQPVWAFNTIVNLNGGEKNLEPVKYLCIISMLKNSPEPIKLTAMDPRAKDLIKNTKPISDSTNANPKNRTDGD